jgi:predicted transposase/invertase (TIGR01784 family)
VARKAKKQDKDTVPQGSPDRKDLLPLRNDIIFKMTFGDVRNKHILRAFLSAMLDLPEEEYDEIEIIDPHLRPGSPNEKLGILDVYVRTKTGKQIDVEIQIARTPFVEERITAYTAKMLSSQLNVGERYAEMKKVITIFILAYNLTKGSDHFHNKYMFCDAKTNSLFTNIVEIHTLELQKLPAETDESGADEKTARQILWLRLIRAEKEEEIEMLAAKSPEIKETYAVLKKLSESEEARLLCESREKAIWDEQARLYSATKDGFEKGVEEGRKEGKRQNTLDIASKLLDMKLDVDSIALATGLTVEEIEKTQGQPPAPEPPVKKRGRPRKQASPKPEAGA